MPERTIEPSSILLRYPEKFLKPSEIPLNARQSPKSILKRSETTETSLIPYEIPWNSPRERLWFVPWNIPETLIDKTLLHLPETPETLAFAETSWNDPESPCDLLKRFVTLRDPRNAPETLWKATLSPPIHSEVPKMLWNVPWIPLMPSTIAPTGDPMKKLTGHRTFGASVRSSVEPLNQLEIIFGAFKQVQCFKNCYSLKQYKE